MSKFIPGPLALLLALLPLAGCLSLLKPRHAFAAYTPATSPNYALDSCWAALPARRDSADAVPLNTTLRDQQATASADVFFLHLTTRILPKGWNADPADTDLNQFTDKFSIKTQASVFNAAGRIYAPHYRQATLYAFFDSTANSSKALELAYQDVKASFRYYLAHYNQGRPIILAGHSQGALHLTHLLKDRVAGKKIAKRIIAAYVVGWPVSIDTDLPEMGLPACTTRTRQP